MGIIHNYYKENYQSKTKNKMYLSDIFLNNKIKEFFELRLFNINDLDYETFYFYQLQPQNHFL